MSDAYFFDADSPAETKKCVDEFVFRCETIAGRVFHKNIGEVATFRAWLDKLLTEVENTFVILHEHPLYLVAEYFGYDIRFIEDGSYAREYDMLAGSMHW